MGCKPTDAFSTLAVHAGQEYDPATGARITPIYQTNGYAFPSVEHGAEIFALRKQGFAYSRASNPTNATLERRICCARRWRDRHCLFVWPVRLADRAADVARKWR